MSNRNRDVSRARQLEIRSYLERGQAPDPLSSNEPGNDVVSIATGAHEVLMDALVGELRKDVGDRSPPPFPPGFDLAQFTRSKLTPMINGLFPAAERERVHDLFEASITFPILPRPSSPHRVHGLATIPDGSGELLDPRVETRHDAEVVLHGEDGGVVGKLIERGRRTSQSPTPRGLLVALIQAARPEAEDRSRPDCVRLIPLGNHAWDEGVHPDLVEGHTRPALEAVQSATDIGVKEGVLELVGDPGSVAAVEDAMAVLGGEEKRRRNCKAGALLFELFDPSLDFGFGSGEGEETEDRSPRPVFPRRWNLEPVRKGERKDREESADSEASGMVVETEIARGDHGVVEDQQDRTAAVEDPLKGFAAFASDPGE